MKLIESLSKEEALKLLELIHDGVRCAKESDFRNLLLNARELIPFDYAICLMGEKSPQNRVTRYELINISYPPEWLCQYLTNNYHLVDPIVQENFANFAVQYWQDSYKKYGAPAAFISEAEDFGLRQGYSSGQKNLQGTEGSLFSFAGINMTRHQRTDAILAHLTPHLHQAFIRILKQSKPHKPVGNLTGKEREILCWVKEGKSTWEMSQILHISQDTVKFHLRNIFRKLNTNNRPHAIAIALERKLIDF